MLNFQKYVIEVTLENKKERILVKYDFSQINISTTHFKLFLHIRKSTERQISQTWQVLNYNAMQAFNVWYINGSSIQQNWHLTFMIDRLQHPFRILKQYLLDMCIFLNLIRRQHTNPFVVGSLFLKHLSNALLNSITRVLIHDKKNRVMNLVRLGMKGVRQNFIGVEYATRIQQFLNRTHDLYLSELVSV